MRKLRTYKQDLQKLKITEDEFDSIISHIYDKTFEEHFALAKSIKAGKKVPEPIKRAFERVLNMRYAERLEIYKFYYNV